MPDGRPYPDALLPGHRIGNYEIVDVLGRGGFGITYQALQLRLDRTVAIKEYLPRGSAVRAADGNVRPISPEESKDYKRGLERYLKEAKMLAQLDHPNIVRVHDYFEAHNTGYIVMEYIEGETLTTRVRGFIDEDELRDILDPLIDGIEVVHKAGILHRDITPNNIMIQNSKTPILIDFGSARDINNIHPQTMTLMGTPQYAAPEQMTGRYKQGTWTDIYGLSAVMFRCITGGRLTDELRAELGSELWEKIWGENMELYRVSMGRKVATRRGLSLKPQERPQTVAEWRALAKEASQATLHKCQRDAELGDIDAQFRLAHMYASGWDAPEDHNMAIKWYQLTAEQGHKASQFRLGILLYQDWKNQLKFKEDMYKHDKYINFGNRPSDNQITKIRRKAERGDANSQLYMGFLHDRLYFCCIPVYDSDYDILRYGQDIIHCAYLFEDNKITYSPKQGIEHHGSIFYDYDENERLNDQEAVKWYELAAKQNIARAQYNLGLKYLYGIGIRSDAIEAERWFRCAAERRHQAAQVHLGFMRFKEHDYTQAYLWCKLATNDFDFDTISSSDYDGHTSACYLLGMMCERISIPKRTKLTRSYDRNSISIPYSEDSGRWYSYIFERHPGAMHRQFERSGRKINEDLDKNLLIKRIKNRCLSAVSGDHRESGVGRDRKALARALARGLPLSSVIKDHNP